MPRLHVGITARHVRAQFKFVRRNRKALCGRRRVVSERPGMTGVVAELVCGFRVVSGTKGLRV